MTDRPLPPGFAGVVSRLEALASRLLQDELVIDAIILDLYNIADECVRTTPAVRVKRFPRRALSREQREALQRAAAYGVGTLVTEVSPDGATRFRLDGGRQFTLPLKLGRLLVVLAADQGQSEDDWVAWKSRDEIITRLTTGAGRGKSRSGLPQAIHQLRAKLFAAGVNPLLVNTHRSLGARFALRRKSARVAEVMEGDGE